MRRAPILLIPPLLLALAALAQTDGAATPEGAIACAAARYRGEALSVRWRPREQAWELRWLTPAGNVLRIDVSPPGCRFRRIDGVGQEAARIDP